MGTTTVKPSGTMGTIGGTTGVHPIKPAGYIFCPYVPLTQTPVVLDPETIFPDLPEIKVKPKRYRSIDDPWEPS